MKFKLIFFIVFYLTLSVVGEKFRFDNYSLYKILPASNEQTDLLIELQSNGENKLDFWNDPVPKTKNYVMVMSSPAEKGKLEEFLNTNQIGFNITIPNIQEQIEKEKVQTTTRSGPRSMVWNAYYTLEGIYAWLDNLIAYYPNVVTPIVGGVSYEGRPIRGIKISHGSGRRAVLLEGGIHAREWISPATVNFITDALLSSDDEITKEAAREYDWYIFPVTNPDGYIYSHEEFRMWRKNRRVMATSTGPAFGVDLNRNWNSNWLVYGASSLPASDTYAGNGPFSEPETRSLSNFIMTIDQLDLYLSIHSFGQMLLVPFGNTTEPVGNYHDAVDIGRRAMGALSVKYGTRYITGNVAEILYFATGGSDEWVKEHLHVPLVYCYELRDNGSFGFLLPTDQIQPTGEETLDSVLELIHQAKRLGYMNNAGIAKISVIMMLFSLIVMIMMN